MRNCSLRIRPTSTTRIEINMPPQARTWRSPREVCGEMKEIYESALVATSTDFDFGETKTITEFLRE